MRLSLCWFLAVIGNVFKTCHDAADDEAGGKTKERRRSDTVNKLAHEVYGPSNQMNATADDPVGGGAGPVFNRSRRIALQALAFQLGWDIAMAHLIPGYMIFRDACTTRRSSCRLPDFALTR
jgi:hypothetical protein